MTRFPMDVRNSRTFSGFLRAPVKRVLVSGGEDPKNIIDWNDQGQLTFWNSVPAAGEPFSWVVLDMGKPTPVIRFWMLPTRSTTPAPGWLIHILPEYTDDPIFAHIPNPYRVVKIHSWAVSPISSLFFRISLQ